MYTVGKNVQGCLGLAIPDFTIQSQAIRVDLLWPAVSISVSDRLVYCIDSQGNTMAWGDNIYGQISRLPTEVIRLPAAVKFDDGVIVDRIVAAGSHTAALYQLQTNHETK